MGYLIRIHQLTSRNLATNYFEMAREAHPDLVTDIDLGYVTPHSPHYRSYQNAVAAGGNYAILNRLIIFEPIHELTPT